ncbi:hypothetical protein AQJ84_36985 [Streptomyces resistomycificus]|nr:hypothetical protein AQJ84_36985 [Streptomyces resistomycificus]
MRRSGRARTAVVLAAAVGLLTGTALVVTELNSPTFGLEAAPRGDAPECARVAKDSPDGVGGQRRDDVTLPGVAVWGDGSVVLRCGLRPPAPTVDHCLTVDDVDWVWREARSRDGEKVLITYGRNPAVELTVSDRVTAIDDVLVELSHAVRPIRQKNECVSAADVPATVS